MPEADLSTPDEDNRDYTGKDVVYRERGVTPLDVQRAADALLRLGQKPSVAAVREQLGGGSPNTVGPLLDQYWKGLGRRLPAGPQALERVPESMARLTEALWLRTLDEALERAKALHRADTPTQQSLAALERKVTELTAALAESRAKLSENESELLTSLRDRLDLREQVQQLTALLAAEHELRAKDQGAADSHRLELSRQRAELLELARRRLAIKVSRKRAASPPAVAKRGTTPKRKASAKAKVSGGPRTQRRKVSPRAR